MTTRNLEPDQWRNREEWRLVSGRRRQLLKKPHTHTHTHTHIYIYIYKSLFLTYETSKINNTATNYYAFLSTPKPENFLQHCDSAISNSTLCISSLPREHLLAKWHQVNAGQECIAAYFEKETVHTKTLCRINYKCEGQTGLVNQHCNVPGGGPHISEWHSVVSSLPHKHFSYNGVEQLYLAQLAKKTATQTKLKMKMVGNVCTEQTDIHVSAYMFCGTDLRRKGCTMHQIFLSFIAKTKSSSFRCHHLRE